MTPQLPSPERVAAIRRALARQDYEWPTGEIVSDLLDAYDALTEERDRLREEIREIRAQQKEGA